MLAGAEATTAPVAGSMRSSMLLLLIAYSEPSALTSVPWTRSRWSISAALQGKPPMVVAGAAVWEIVGVGVAVVELTDEAGAPPDDAGGVWWELASTAMPALAPAMTTTAA